MRILDCAKIGWASIWGQRRRTLMVVIVVGALFSVMMAATLVLKGTEKIVVRAETQKTQGKVLLLVTVDQLACGNDCNYVVELERARELVDGYGGEAVEGKLYRGVAGTFYAAPDILAVERTLASEDDNVAIVAISTDVARRYLKLNLQSDMSASQKLRVMEEVARRVAIEPIVYNGMIGAGVDEGANEVYRVMELLPSGVGVNSLSLSEVGDDYNVLNLVLNDLQTGGSLNFVLQPSVEMLATELAMSEVGQIWAVFPDVAAATKFTHDKANACSEVAASMGNCRKEYRFKVQPALANPLVNAQSFAAAWSLLHGFMMVFALVAAVVVLTTFLRLMYGDAKTVALYRALGARQIDIYQLQLVYLLMISLMAVGLALIVAFILVLALNWANQTLLMQIFSLGFGERVEQIWLVGFSPEIAWLVGMMVSLAPVGVLMASPAFSAKGLARKLK